MLKKILKLILILSFMGIYSCNMYKDKKVDLTAEEVLKNTREKIDPDYELNDIASLKFKAIKVCNTKTRGAKYIESAYFFLKPDNYKMLCYFFTEKVATKTNDLNFISCYNGKFAWRFAKSYDNEKTSFHLIDNLSIAKQEFEDAFHDMALGIFRNYEKIVLFPEKVTVDNVKCYRLYFSFNNTDYINEKANSKSVEIEYYIDANNFKIKQVETLAKNKIVTNNIKYKKFGDVDLPYKFQRNYPKGILPYDKDALEITDFSINDKLSSEFFALPPKTSEVWDYLN
jgi:hypothetical protein